MTVNIVRPWARTSDERDRAASALAHGLRAASHDIRQPVAAVLALAEAARVHPDTTPELRGYLDAIREQATWISETARAVLDVEGLRAPERAPVRVDKIVREALDVFRVTWTGTLSHDGRPGPLLVLGDAGLLRRSVVNVIDNAARAAGPDGTVAVKIRVDDGEVLVVVEDDGPGFGRIASGTGIGLGLTRETLAGMGGDVVIDAERGARGGARVVLRMPLLVDVDEQRPHAHMRAAG